MSDPMVCVSLDGCTVKDMIDEAARSNIAGADVVEVRFDRIYLVRPQPVETIDEESGEIRRSMPDESEWERTAVADVKVEPILAELKGGIPLPVIFTCRPSTEGGFFPGSEEERCAVLEKAIDSGVSFVDIEISMDDSTRDGLIKRAESNSVKVIASSHGDGVPSSDKIVEMVKENDSKGDVLKLCWTTESQQESLEMVEASWQLKGEGMEFAMMGLGPGGDWTRLHAPVLEQSIVYSTLQNDFHLGDRGLVNVRDLRDAWSLMEY